MRSFACLSVICALAATAADSAPETPGLASFLRTDGNAAAGRIVSIDKDKVTYRPKDEPKKLASLELKKIASIEYPGTIAAGEERFEVIELRGGSWLMGKFLGFDKGRIRFQLHQGGKVFVPLAEMQVFRKPKAQTPSGDIVFNKHVVMADTGDVFIGDIKPTSDAALEIKGAVQVKVPYGRIMAIYPPRPAQGRRAAEPTTTKAAAPPPRVTVVTLKYGAILAGRELAVKDGTLSLTILKDQRVGIPLEGVLCIEPGQMAGATLAGMRGVLAWGAYSDRSQEFPWTVAALKAKLPANWKIHEDFSTSFGKDFRGRLFRSRTLLIPEPESWGSGEKAELAADLKKVVEPFLRRGGNVVILGASTGPVKFLADAGLLDVTRANSRSSGTIRVTAAGKKIAKDVGQSFEARNSTYFYRIGTKYKAQSWADDPGGQGSAIVARRVGLGWVILMGMDYYTRSDELNQLLLNAVLCR